MREPFVISTRYHGRPIVTDVSSGTSVTGHNEVVYQGADILAGLAAGVPHYNLNTAYIEFQNNASPTIPPAAQTDTAISRQAFCTGQYDLLRCPLIAQPVITSSGSHYAGNDVSLTFLASQTVGLIQGLPFSPSDNSNIVSVCVLASPLGSTYTGDLLYARFALASALAVTGTAQVTLVYPLQWL
jgi:hypothetical protein